MKVLTNLLVVVVGILLHCAHAAAQQQIPIPRYGIAISLPASWANAPDAVVEVLNAGLARRTGYTATEVVALLVPDTAQSWVEPPYIMIRVDTVDTYDSKSEVANAMGEAGIVIRDFGNKLSSALREKELIASFEFGTVYYDSAAARLWIRGRGTTASGRAMQVVSGSQIYRGGRIGISYYAPVDMDAAVPTTFVSRMLDELHIPAGMGLPQGKSSPPELMQEREAEWGDLLPSTLLGNVVLDWVAAGILAALFYGISRVLPDASAGRKLLEWLAILSLAAVVALHILGRSL